MGKYYIGFDAGTQSVKVVMYSLEMECIAEANYPTFSTSWMGPNECR